MKHGGDGTAFCSLHRADAPSRVPCPLDPRHDVKAADVDRHLKLCPARITALCPWLTLDINRPVAAHRDCRSDSATPWSARRVQEMHRDEGLSFASWLCVQHALLDQQSWWRAVPLPSDHSVFGETLPMDRRDAETVQSYLSGGGAKHRQQQVALCKLLRVASAPALPDALIEVGAGKGGVACCAKLLDEELCAVLVERSIYRDPKERELNKRLRRDERSTSSAIKRVAIDAKDFNAPLWWASHASGKGVTTEGAALRRSGACVVGKHLCGNCSDYAIQIALSLAADALPRCGKRPRDCSGGDGGVVPLVLATCCHHLCSFSDYCGSRVELLSGGDAVRLFPSERYFDLCRSICGWAIIDVAVDAASGYSAPEAHFGASDRTEDEPSRSSWSADLSIPEKIKLGRMAKRLIDGGRVGALAHHGAHAEYIQYAQRNVTGECYAIVCRTGALPLDAQQFDS